MKKKIFSFLILISFTLTSISAQETVKVMFYNVLNSPIENTAHGLISCWNTSINSSECETIGSQFSYTLRKHLHNFSDHLPVTLSLETDATFLSVDQLQFSTRFSLDDTLINDKLVVTIDAVELHNQTLIIYNSLGQQVKVFQMSSDTKKNIDVSNLQQGLYYLTASQSRFNPLKFIIL